MTVNKPCTLFYIFELQGTPVESNEEVIQRVYEGLGNYINVREAGNITFDITGLAAETNYILYAVVEDTSLNTS